jgi:hypothetical protein
MEIFSSDIWLKWIEEHSKAWTLQKTFNNALDAKRYAARMFVFSNGVMVAPYTGGTFSVFTWVK